MHLPVKVYVELIWELSFHLAHTISFEKTGYPIISPWGFYPLDQTIVIERYPTMRAAAFFSYKEIPPFNRFICDVCTEKSPNARMEMVYMGCGLCPHPIYTPFPYLWMLFSVDSCDEFPEKNHVREKRARI
jgi:hypothetical protein